MGTWPQPGVGAGPVASLRSWKFSLPAGSRLSLQDLILPDLCVCPPPQLARLSAAPEATCSVSGQPCPTPPSALLWWAWCVWTARVPSSGSPVTAATAPRFWAPDLTRPQVLGRAEARCSQACGALAASSADQGSGCRRQSGRELLGAVTAGRPGSPRACSVTECHSRPCSQASLGRGDPAGRQWRLPSRVEHTRPTGTHAF